MSDERVLWLYAVAFASSQETFGGLAGVGGGPLQPIRSGRLMAIAELVPAAEFGEEALRERLEDLSWLERVARAHHAIITAAASPGPAVPMRLATIYSTPDSLREMLAGRAPDLEAVLGRLQDRSEWGVKAFAAPAQSRPEATTQAPRARRGPGAGKAYLQRRGAELGAREQTRQRSHADARRVHAALCEVAADYRLHRPQAPELTGRTEAMVLNGAYLLGHAHAKPFADTVELLRREHPGLRLELTGPWPPYSFADVGGPVPL